MYFDLKNYASFDLETKKLITPSQTNDPWLYPGCCLAIKTKIFRGSLIDGKG